MRRRAVHLAFGALALVCATAASVDGARLFRAVQVNRAIAATSFDAANSIEQATAPQTILAHALALSAKGDPDAAVAAYNRLIARDPRDDAGRAALFDLGNLYLRLAMGSGDANDSASMPMIELAKERYRTLLRIAPDDWDARYNLERALRLAPETDESFDTVDQPVDRRTVRLPGFTTEDLP